jgi:hypothetical protein
MAMTRSDKMATVVGLIVITLAFVLVACAPAAVQQAGQTTPVPASSLPLSGKLTRVADSGRTTLWKAVDADGTVCYFTDSDVSASVPAPLVCDFSK